MGPWFMTMGTFISESPSQPRFVTSRCGGNEIEKIIYYNIPNALSYVLKILHLRPIKTRFFDAKVVRISWKCLNRKAMLVLAGFRHLHFREISRVIEAFTPIFCTIPHSMYILPLDPLKPLKRNNPHLY